MTCDCSRENCLCNDKEINFLYKTYIISFPNYREAITESKVSPFYLHFVVYFFILKTSEAYSNFGEEKNKKKMIKICEAKIKNILITFNY